MGCSLFKENNRKMDELSFGRESFDRFGDDLCELILSYLPIADCFRFECVSKQWKALIFNGQKRLNASKCISNPNPNPLDVTDLDMNERNISFNASLFAYLLKKCTFINKLIISNINDDIMNAIASNCSHLKSLTIGSILDDISEHSIKRFGEKFGPKLETLYIESMNSKILRQLFPLMTNLRKISIGVILPRIPNVNLFIADANHTHFLPKLEEIGSKIFIYNSFITFAEQYRKQIKKLYVCPVVRENELENNFDSFRQLSQFECLQSIKINCGFIHCELNTFINLLKSMARDCKNLKELELENMCDRRLFDCFADGFESLRKLSLKTFKVDVNCANFEFLKRCVNVTHFSLFQKLLHTNQFVDCDIFVPQLTSLRVSTEEAFTDDILRCLTKLKHLSTLKMECRGSANKHNVSSTGICYLIDNCATLRKIHLSVEDIQLISMKELEKRAVISLSCGQMLITVKSLSNQPNNVTYYCNFDTHTFMSAEQLIRCLTRDELLQLPYQL